MEFATDSLRWTREPESFLIAPDKIEIVTKPRTDLWQRTYYHFQNDNAPVLQMETAEPFFSFVVRTDFTESHHRFDQCGVVDNLEQIKQFLGYIISQDDVLEAMTAALKKQGDSNEK